jgi:16S rRNA G966 N2-methylase RsmD
VDILFTDPPYDYIEKLYEENGQYYLATMLKILGEK